MQNVVLIDSEQFFQRLEEILEAKLPKISMQQPEGEILPELLTRKQAADFLICSLGTIDNLTRSGVLQKHYLGRSPKFKKEELLQAFESWKKFQRL